MKSVVSHASVEEPPVQLVPIAGAEELLGRGLGCVAAVVRVHSEGRILLVILFGIVCVVTSAFGIAVD